MSTPSPADPSVPEQKALAAPSQNPAKKPLAWRVANTKEGVAATPSCNPNFRPPAPGK